MSELSVRMYRQGLGDCFLLTCGPWHALIDCGVLKPTEDATTKMQAVAKDVMETTGGRLDVLVATHEHWDHLSGFLQADAFEPLEADDVWLAWTEDPRDDLAKELRGQRAQALRAVAAAATRLREAGDDAALDAAPIDALLEFHGDLGVGAAMTTGAALDWVKARAKPKPRYLRPGEQLAPDGVPGLRVYVLGPPHDRRAIRRSDPSKAHPEVYELTGDTGADAGFYAAAATLAAAAPGPCDPFQAWFRVEEHKAGEEPFFVDGYWAQGLEWRRIEHDWLAAAGRLALQLDSDTNNTSLALAFELGDGGPVLLFPGDAQVGNWESWQRLTWQVDGRTVTTDDLFGRTVLYKVGHHASHNATLREHGLELMASRELVAMIPVNRATAAKMRWNMPFPPLHDRLEEKTGGRILDAETGVPAANPGHLPAADWARFTGRTVEQPGWLEYTIEW
jgi:hypothetical protein